MVWNVLEAHSGFLLESGHQAERSLSYRERPHVGAAVHSPSSESHLQDPEDPSLLMLLKAWSWVRKDQVASDAKFKGEIKIQ